MQLINQQITLMEALGIQLLEAKALLTVAEEAHFWQYSQSVNQAYFWVLNDIVEEANSISEQCLERLWKTIDLNRKLH